MSEQSAVRQVASSLGTDFQVEPLPPQRLTRLGGLSVTEPWTGLQLQGQRVAQGQCLKLAAKSLIED